MTAVGVMLKAILLVSELSLPLTGDEMRSKWVSTLLKKLKIVLTTTYNSVTLGPLLKVNDAVT